VIAPDLKGFGQSDKPQDASLYIMPNLLKDVVGILDQLDVQKVHCVVGHDWGAAVAWQLAGRFPKRFERLVALSVGHNASMFSMGGNRQREKSWYMLFFKVHASCCCHSEPILAFCFAKPRQHVWRKQQDPVICGCSFMVCQRKHCKGTTGP